MKVKTRWLVSFTLLFVVLSSTFGCVPPTPTEEGDGGPPPPVCPPAPIGAGDKVTIGNNDDSAIEVFSNTYAYIDDFDNDDTNDVAWCNSDSNSKLGIALYSGNVPACQLDKCLAVVNLSPDDVKINQPVGEYSGKPVLSYDLSVHVPKIDPESCINKYCYAYYRLVGNSWLWVGNAKAVWADPKYMAEGKVGHFSVYAIVELPPAQDVIGPREFQLVVASRFLLEDDGALRVVLAVESDSFGDENLGRELLFSFFSVDPSQPIDNVPEECFDGRDLDQQFTCLFPIGTVIELIVDGGGEQNSHSIYAIDEGYGLNFYSSPVQIYQ